MALADRLRKLGFAPPSRSSGRPDSLCGRAVSERRTLRVYLIKPSRYDDDGWVMRYRWGVIPNNTLTVLAGLFEASAAAAAIDLQLVIWDELVDGVITGEVVDSIAARGARDGVEVLIGLAGVQTSQYPRARDLALQFVRVGLPVLIGGFHVSSHEASAEFLSEHGVAVVVGEADTILPRILGDFLDGGLRRRYTVTAGLSSPTGSGSIIVPAIGDTAMPAIDDRYAGRFFNPTFATIDTSRGCPFACSYCSVKNVMGRRMRSRDPAQVVRWVRAAHDEHGIRNLLVVDDDLFRSPEWDAIFVGLAELRRSGREVALIIQTDIESAAHESNSSGSPNGAARDSRRFVDLAAAAGCFEVFMGFESFDPANLERTLKFHNQERSDRRRASRDPEHAAERVKQRYRRVVDNWHAAGVGVHSGYMIGLPFDGAGCGQRAARDLAEVGVDIASFFACTPLPGSEDYDAAVAAGTIDDTDFNAYDSTHFVARHPRLTAVELQREYAEAYRTFYSWRRLAWSVATRHGVAGLSTSARYGMLAQQFYFTYAARRGWHPMMGGIGRLREGERREAVSDRDALARYGSPRHDPPPIMAAPARTLSFPHTSALD